MEQRSEPTAIIEELIPPFNDSKFSRVDDKEKIIDKLNSPSFAQKKEFLYDLFNPINKVYNYIGIDEIEKGKRPIKYSPETSVIENLYVKSWENVENISSRLIEKHEDYLILECLIDKDNKLYENRNFPCSIFQNYSLEIGNLFLLRFFERGNEFRLEVHEGKGLVLEEDFPKTNYTELFKKSKLFK